MTDATVTVPTSSSTPTSPPASPSSLPDRRRPSPPSPSTASRRTGTFAARTSQACTSFSTRRRPRAGLGRPRRRARRRSRPAPRCAHRDRRREDRHPDAGPRLPAVRVMIAAMVAQIDATLVGLRTAIIELDELDAPARTSQAIAYLRRGPRRHAAVPPAHVAGSRPPPDDTPRSAHPRVGGLRRARGLGVVRRGATPPPSDGGVPAAPRGPAPARPG